MRAKVDRLRRPMEGRLLDRSIDAIRRPCAVMRKDFLPTCQVQPWLQFHEAINMGRNPVDEIPSRIAGQLFTPKGVGRKLFGADRSSRHSFVFSILAIFYANCFDTFEADS